MNRNEDRPFVCPWWIGYFLLIPFRRLVQDPGEILSPHVREGMTVLEVGPGLGYFTLSLARLVGKSGRVICVDLQQKMLTGLTRRAEKAGVRESIAPILASEQTLRLEGYRGSADFALLFAMVHEVPDQSRLFAEVFDALKSGSEVLFSEPAGHVREGDFAKSLETAKKCGFTVTAFPNIWRSRSALLRK